MNREESCFSLSSNSCKYTWAEIKLPSNQGVYGIASNPATGFTVMAGGAFSSGNSGFIATSNDMIIWTQRSTPNNKSLVGITFSPTLGMYVAVGRNQAGTQVLDQIITSTNGIDWTEVVLSATKSYNLNAVTWSHQLDLFCAIGTRWGGDDADKTPSTFTSPDGINWTQQTPAMENSNFAYDICWSKELQIFCAVGIYCNEAYGSLVATSPDGINWTHQICSTPTNGILRGICWSSELNLFVATGTVTALDGYIYTSPDAVTWTSRFYASKYLRQVSWSSDAREFVAVGSGGYIVHSTDGMIWNQMYSGNNATIRCVNYNEKIKRWILGAAAVGADSFVSISSSRYIKGVFFEDIKTYKKK